MRKKNKESKSIVKAPESVSTTEQQSNCCEGERLVYFLKSLNRELESAKLSKGTLPDNIWIKQQFSIGVNDVTRVLERMKPISDLSDPSEDSGEYKASQVRLQAVLLATDCNPRWLTKHLPSLASSRKVPIISIRDKKGGSLRLGEILKLKTAIAIGVKARGTCINKLIEEILHSNLANIGDKELSEVS